MTQRGLKDLPFDWQSPTGWQGPRTQVPIPQPLSCGAAFAFPRRRMTLKIATASDGETAVLRLSGQIDEDHLAQLDAEIRRYRPRLVFDLAEATLVDRAAVQFLAAREGEGIDLVNCPRYIREWITKERNSVGA